MIELFIALLIIPALTIGWDRLMLRMSVNAKRVYRLTGYVGYQYMSWPTRWCASFSVCG